MANYTASCRSNYFRVKDATAFRAAMTTSPDIKINEDERGFCVMGCYADGGGWPAWHEDPQTGELAEFDLFGAVAAHLAPGEVAIFMEVGAEKLRYLVGYAVAINHKGKRCTVSLQEIYAKAGKLAGSDSVVTRAEY